MTIYGYGLINLSLILNNFNERFYYYMNCIYCGGNTQVTNSRPQKRSNAIWRRRKCKSCDNIISSVERVDLAQALRIELLSGKIVPFYRDILFVSIYDCLKHRSNSVNDATEITDTVILKLTKLHKAVIKREQLIDISKEILAKFDNVALVQYSAFHKH